ncbi:hypothetical protein R1flu_014684 [Riccia fluitans]|uniref:Uncharacterized protein n=1 Tax=Riccia fluitans TaxID=41844 RepID=A0ABD1YH23_9MARC
MGSVLQEKLWVAGKYAIVVIVLLSILPILLPSGIIVTSFLHVCSPSAMRSCETFSPADTCDDDIMLSRDRVREDDCSSPSVRSVSTVGTFSEAPEQWSDGKHQWSEKAEG